VFPVRYELNSYILFRRNTVFKGLMYIKTEENNYLSKVVFFHSATFQRTWIRNKNRCNCLLSIYGSPTDTQNNKEILLR
jgi:hypothetical protein